MIQNCSGIYTKISRDFNNIKNNRSNAMKKFRLIILTASVIISTSLINLHAEEAPLFVPYYSSDYSVYADSSTYVAQLNNDTGNTKTDSISDASMHKMLGYATLGSAAATFAALGFGSKGLHCGLAYTSTVLAAATCATGYYSYSDVLGNDTKYTAHAVLGTLATVGFGAALALADGGQHAAVGGTSGVVFVITVGILYF